MADVSITTANVKKTATTVSDRGVAGASITAGMPLYRDATDSSKMKPADANSSQATAAVVGVALHPAAADQPIEFATGGDINPGFTVGVGSYYIASANAGAVAPVADATTGWRPFMLGVGTAADNLKLIMHNSGVAVP